MRDVFQYNTLIEYFYKHWTLAVNSIKLFCDEIAFDNMLDHSGKEHIIEEIFLICSFCLEHIYRAMLCMSAKESNSLTVCYNQMKD